MDVALPTLTTAKSAPELPAVRDDGRWSEAALDKVARDFEAAFLAEMLKHTGVGDAPEGFGGGAGEEQFVTFLREAQAREMAQAGGIGLREFIVSALRESNNAG
ncbi:MAG: rod-binding protein [Pseudomonadota bacterium]